MPIEQRCARTAAAGGGHAVRSRALGAPSTAVGRHACGRPRRGAVAAVLPHWDDDDDRLPGGRLTRALPPRANGHDRGAWCERRNRTASARWAPRLHGQPASRLHWHALVRAAFDNIGSDRRGLRARHADTHAQSITRGAPGLKVRRSPSIGRAVRYARIALPAYMRIAGTTLLHPTELFGDARLKTNSPLRTWWSLFGRAAASGFACI